MKLNTAKQSGFTLIELVMVIVILGILAAVALPKFIDLKSDAANAAAQGVAGALAAGSAMNRAAKLAGTNGVAITNCSSLGTLLDGGLTSGYGITAGALSSTGSGSCTVTGPNSSTATFTAYGA